MTARRLPAPVASGVRAHRSIVIRAARPSDATVIARLALLSDRRPPEAPLLVAEVDGEVLAASPVDGGPAVTDPFVVTLDVSELLALRAAQLRAAA